MFAHQAMGLAGAASGTAGKAAQRSNVTMHSAGGCSFQAERIAKGVKAVGGTCTLTTAQCSLHDLFVFATVVPEAAAEVVRITDHILAHIA